MRDLVYRVVVAGFRGLFVLLGLQIDIRGAQHLPEGDAAVVAINHVSYLDFAVVGLAAHERRRLIRFMAKQASFDNPVTGPFMRAMHHVPVDRRHGELAYRHAERALQHGELVGVFPEATISRSWTLRPFKLGAASLAVREQVPIVPVITWGAHRLITVGGRRDLRRRGVAVTVLVGDPLDPPPPAADDAGHDAAVAELGDRLREQMATMLEQVQRGYPDSPAPGEDPWWLPRHLGGSAPEPAEALALDDAG
ncbi:lysophospholipid acyltransferase family protein, partial [Rhodococcus aerolatus]